MHVHVKFYFKEEMYIYSYILAVLAACIHIYILLEYALASCSVNWTMHACACIQSGYIAIFI